MSVRMWHFGIEIEFHFAHKEKDTKKRVGVGQSAWGLRTACSLGRAPFEKKKKRESTFLISSCGAFVEDNRNI